MSGTPFDGAPAPDGLGLASGTVRVVPHDPRWAVIYAAEARRLQEYFAARGVVVALEHTGSTAVEGLAAKPIIDILGGRQPGAARDRIISTVVEAGYVYRGEQGIPGRDFFRRGNPRSFHLHLTELDSTFWHDHRTFRDYLRTEADAREAYAELKQDLARRFPTDREAYIAGKTEFVLRVLSLGRYPIGWSEEER